MRCRLLPFVLWLGLAACSDAVGPLEGPPVDPAELSLTPGAAIYAPGAEITVQVLNASDREYAFNPCMWQLQRHSGIRWVPAEKGGICNADAIRLPAHATVTANRGLPAGLRDGMYRVAGQFTYAEEGQSRTHVQTSAPFEIGN